MLSYFELLCTASKCMREKKPTKQKYNYTLGRTNNRITRSILSMKCTRKKNGFYALNTYIRARCRRSCVDRCSTWAISITKSACSIFDINIDSNGFFLVVCSFYTWFCYVSKVYRTILLLDVCVKIWFCLNVTVSPASFRSVKINFTSLVTSLPFGCYRNSMWCSWFQGDGFYGLIRLQPHLKFNRPKFIND